MHKSAAPAWGGLQQSALGASSSAAQQANMQAALRAARPSFVAQRQAQRATGVRARRSVRVCAKVSRQQRQGSAKASRPIAGAGLGACRACWGRSAPPRVPSGTMRLPKPVGGQPPAHSALG